MASIVSSGLSIIFTSLGSIMSDSYLGGLVGIFVGMGVVGGLIGLFRH